MTDFDELPGRYREAQQVFRLWCTERGLQTEDVWRTFYDRILNTHEFINADEAIVCHKVFEVFFLVTQIAPPSF